MSKKLYVGNLSYSTTESQLRGAFAEIGTVTDVAMIQDRETGRPKGFAFVEMADDAEAEAAIAQLNGKDFDGRNITVAEARPRAERPDSRGGYGGGNRGGGYGGGGRSGGYGGGGGRSSGRDRW